MAVVMRRVVGMEVTSAELSLSWDDHNRSLCAVFEELLESNTLVDCTIAAEGQYVKAHKLVLSACSPYFQILFSQEIDRNPIVVLKDIKYDELRAIIDFVYRGKVSIPHDQLGQFLEVAKSLQIKGLANHKKKGTEDGASRSEPGSGRASPPSRKRRRNNLPGDDNRTSFLRGESHAGSGKSADELSKPSLRSSGEASMSSQMEATVSERLWADSRSPLSQDEMVEVETIIKSEPDTDPEFLSEVFETEPKCEQYISEMSVLDGGDENSNGLGGNGQRQAEPNEYAVNPGFEAPDDSFLVTQMAEDQGVQGPGLAAHLPHGSVQQAVPVSMFQLHPLSTNGGMTAVASVCMNNASAPQLATIVTQTNGHLQPQPSPLAGQLTLFQTQAQGSFQPIVPAPVPCPRPPAPPPLPSQVPVQAAKPQEPAEKVYQCFVCTRVFSRPQELISHERVHSTIRKFQCNACRKTFGRSGDFLIHRRLVCGSRKMS